MTSQDLIDKNQKDPNILINEEQGISEENHENFFSGYCQFLKFSYKIIISFMIQALLNNVEMYFQMLFINLKYNSNKDMINSIGSINTIFQMSLNVIIISSILSVQLKGSNYYSKNNMKGFSNVIFRSRIIFVCLYTLVGLILIACHTPLFKLLNYSQSQQKYSFILLCFKILAMYFDYEYTIMLNVLLISGKGLYVFVILAIVCGLNILYAYLYIMIGNFGIASVGLNMVTTKLSAMLIIWAIGYFLKLIHPKILKKTKKAFLPIEIWNQTKFTLIAIPIVFFDSIDNEIMSISAGYLQIDSYTAYNITYSLYNIFACIPSGFYSGTTLTLSYSIGEKNLKKSIKWFFYLILTALGFSGVIIAIIFVPYKLLLGTLTNYPNVLKIAHSTYYLFLSTILIESINNILRNTLKALQLIWTSNILGLFMIGFEILCISMLGFYFKLGLFGIVFGYIMYLLLSALSTSLILWIISWEKCINDISHSLVDSDKNLCEENEPLIK